MNTFEGILREFDSVLKRHNKVNYDKLQEPLSDSSIAEYLKRLNIDDENFRLLYRWKNGITSEFGATLNDDIFEFGALMSLKNVEDHYFHGVQNEMWRKNFVPIVNDGDTAHLLFNNEEGANYGKLYLYCVPLLYIDEPISYYDSIPTMIKTTLVGYEEKAMVYDASNDCLNIDLDKLNRLCEELNPNSEFWKT